jgi:hypothetical protein
MKKLLVVSMFAAVSVFAAQSYRVTLFQPSIVANQELKAGDYKVVVDGDKMTISQGKTSVTADVKTETAESKFDKTSVRYQNGDGKYRLREIRIGGTNTKLVLN